LTRRSHYQTRTAKKKERERERKWEPWPKYLRKTSRL
jgi:hypothetical protein